MTQIHEPGEVWHIGWDWHVGMWYIEPPFEVELDEPMIWKGERHEAFEFVDQWLRERPVENSVVDALPSSQFAVADYYPDEGSTATPPYQMQQPQIAQPTRQVADIQPIPSLTEAKTERERRLAEYAQRVGIK